MNRIVKRSLVLAGASMVFPVGYLCSYQAGLIHSFPDWGTHLWPTGILLLATEGREGDTLFAAQVIAASLASNAVLWVLVGLFLLWLKDTWLSKWTQ